MFDSIKLLIGSSPAKQDEGLALATWAKSQSLVFKRVKDKSGGGYVVETDKGWRVEWGASQRPYIAGKELRFRCDTGLPGDVQMIMVSKVVALITPGGTGRPLSSTGSRIAQSLLRCS